MKLLLWILLFPSVSQALDIPKRLDAQDRREVSRMLGLNTSTKMLSNPYPLGGYSGLEIGVSMEIIDVEDLSRLGCQSTDPDCPNQVESDEKELRYPRISIGKGLYQNLDLFLNFIPPLYEGLSDFGGALRWSFFQAKFLPINFSILLHANRMNIQDTITTQSAGGELIAGINVRNFSIYFGGGFLETQAQFIGGDQGTGTVESPSEDLQTITNTTAETVRSSHTLVGVSLHFGDFFWATQIDKYRDPVLSAKLGLRY